MGAVSEVKVMKNHGPGYMENDFYDKCGVCGVRWDGESDAVSYYEGISAGGQMLHIDHVKCSPTVFHRETVVLKGLDIGEVVVAGLIKLGRLPEPVSGRLDKYKVSVWDFGSFCGKWFDGVEVPLPAVRVESQ